MTALRSFNTSTVGYARRVIESGSFSGIVAFYNALETEMLDLMPQMEAAGMGFVGIRPLAAGLLTDRRIQRDKLSEDDRLRATHFDRWYDQLAELRAALPSEPSSWTRFAVQFALAHPSHTSTVVGINSPEQLRTLLEAADGDYSGQEVLQAAHEACSSFRDRHGIQGHPSGVPTY